MNERVKLSVFYPYPIHKVWQAISDRRILNTWMMNNDFEPRLGHKFKFEREPLPGIKTVIQCEVVELNEPKRLAYTWKDEITSEPTLVIWTLTPVEGGTQLQLKHLQTGYATTLVRDRHRDFPQIRNSHNLIYQQPIIFNRQMPQVSWHQHGDCTSWLRSSVPPHQMVKDELNSIGDRQDLKEDWDYRLNHLLEVLTH